MSYAWLYSPSQFTDRAMDVYLISREGEGLVARFELSVRVPFHTEHVERLCGVFQAIEDDINEVGYPMLDGGPVL